MPTSTRHSPERDWRAWRESTGLSLAEVARRARINKGIVSDIENRERLVRPEWAMALADVYRAEEEQHGRTDAVGAVPAEGTDGQTG